MADNLQPSMVDLSQIISDRTVKIDQLLESKKLPKPSFTADAPSPDFVPYNEPQLREWRNEVRLATQQLHDLIAGPKASLLELIMLRLHDTWTLQAIYEFKIAESVPLSGTTTYASIAQKTGLEEDKCRRILRYAMTNHVFHEPHPEHVAHTAISALLAREQGARDATGHCLDEVFAGTAHEVAALRKYHGSVHPGEAGISLGFGIEGRDIFDFFRSEPHRAQRFGGAMSFIGGPGTDLAAEVEVAGGYPWASLGKAKMVDCGGSRGYVSVAVAHVAPEMHFVIQDLPEVVSQAEAHPPKELESRFKYEAYDFFTPQPIKDADVYFFRRILHDWPDHKVVEILVNLVPSMKPRSRIILNETILTPPGNASANPSEVKVGQVLDMQMMVAANARERSLDDWRNLFEKGSEGKLHFEKGEKSILVWSKKEE